MHFFWCFGAKLVRQDVTGASDTKVMNAYIEQAMASRQSSSFRLIDFFRLGGAMPEEAVQSCQSSLSSSIMPQSGTVDRRSCIAAGGQWPWIPDVEPLGIWAPGFRKCICCTCFNYQTLLALQAINLRSGPLCSTQCALQISQRVAATPCGKETFAPEQRPVPAL